MPRFADIDLIEVKLPSSTVEDPAIVKLLRPTAGQIATLETSGKEAVFDIITSCIKEWNFLDKEGNIESITVDNVKRLSIADFTQIVKTLNIITETSVEEKKS